MIAMMLMLLMADCCRCLADWASCCNDDGSYEEVPTYGTVHDDGVDGDDDNGDGDGDHDDVADGALVMMIM